MGGSGAFGNSGDGGSAPVPCGAMVGHDLDHDGFTTAQGDCNDCVASMHPDAEEILDNDLDEDCDGFDTQTTDGSVATEHVPCDDDLALDSIDPAQGASAIGLCTGVTSASYTNAVGTGGLDSPLQVGLVERFGTVLPREGSRMLLLSSGVARAPGDADYTPGCDGFAGMMSPPSTPSPDGFPQASPPACLRPAPVDESVELINVAALSLSLHAPDNAVGLSVDFNFYTSDYPSGICSESNDTFVVLMDPPPTGAQDGNIAFDANGQSISVNNGLLQVCTPPDEAQTGPVLLDFQCALGPGDLTDTGFDSGDCLDGFGDVVTPGAATGWLSTSVPVQGGADFALRLAIWDAYNWSRDSSVLVDNFRWIVEASEITTEVPITKPSGPQ